MTTEQAINILNEQIQSLQWVNKATQKTWITQTKSEIEKIFGVGSTESIFLITFKFEDSFLEGTYGIQLPNNNNKQTAIDFLQRCIQTLKRKKMREDTKPNIQYIEKPIIKEVIREVEVVKEVMVYPPKINQFLATWNWIKRRDVLQLIGTIVLILGIPFWLGWYLAENKGEIKNTELKIENKQLIRDTATLGNQLRELKNSFPVRLPLDIPNNEADSNAKNNKKQIREDTTHK